MPPWLSDPSNGFYLILFVLAVITVGLWARNRDRGSAVRAGIMVVVLALVFLCDRLFESPREASIHRVEAISKAINERNWEAFRSHLSEQFEYKKKTKAEFANLVQSVASVHQPRTAAWDFTIPEDQKPSGPNEFLLQFEGKAEVGSNPLMMHFVATFVKDPDGQWRLKTFTAYDYVQKRQTKDIPGL